METTKSNETVNKKAQGEENQDFSYTDITMHLNNSSTNIETYSDSTVDPKSTSAYERDTLHKYNYDSSNYKEESDLEARLIDFLGNPNGPKYKNEVRKEELKKGKNFTIKENGSIDHTFIVLDKASNPFNGFSAFVVKDQRTNKVYVWADGTKGIKNDDNILIKAKELFVDWLFNNILGIGANKIFPQLNSLKNFIDKYQKNAPEGEKITNGIGQSMMGIGMSALAMADGYENITFSTYSGCLNQELLREIKKEWGLNSKKGANLTCYFTPGEPLLQVIKPCNASNMSIYVKEKAKSGESPHSAAAYLDFEDDGVDDKYYKIDSFNEEYFTLWQYPPTITYKTREHGFVVSIQVPVELPFKLVGDVIKKIFKETDTPLSEVTIKQGNKTYKNVSLPNQFSDDDVIGLNPNLANQQSEDGSYYLEVDQDGTYINKIKVKPEDLSNYLCTKDNPDLDNMPSKNPNAKAPTAQDESLRQIFINAGGSSCIKKDPIIFDLNNDGILETTNIKNGVYFDHGNDGFAEASAWVGKNDGILVIDTNNNGVIDNGTEVLLFSDLEAFDTNGDGIIDENDTDFANLKILRGDGTLCSLTELGIASITLQTTEVNIIDENNNKQFSSGSYTKTDGTTASLGEFLFETNSGVSVASEWLEETEIVKLLPDLSGRGKLRSLHQAMLRDPSLIDVVSSFVTETNESTRMSLVRTIIAKWTNVENIERNSRGEFIDAQYLAALEGFFDTAFARIEPAGCICRNCSSCLCDVYPKEWPIEAQAVILRSAYTMLVAKIYAELMQQTHLSPLMDKIEATLDLNNGTGYFNLDEVTETILAAIAENPTAGKDLALQFVTTIKGLGIDGNSNYFDPFNDDCFYTALTKNDRELKWLFDTVGKLQYVDPDGESEGTGADDAFRGENNVENNFHALTGDDVMYGGSQNDNFAACGGDDLLDGGDGDDVLDAQDGNDIIFAGNGDDIIHAGAGDDIIFGDDGDDVIYPDHFDDFNVAEDGNDIIRGGKGNDTIYSEVGDDTFIFNLGDGQDVVYEKQGVDTFYFGNGISWDDLTFEQSGNDMIIKINNTSDQITVKDWFLTSGEDYKYDNNKIEIFEFADGSKHYKDEILVGDNTDALVYNMSELGDYIETADNYKTVINFKSGWNHVVAGENSNDTYVLTEGDADIFIQDYSGENTLKFGEGITLANTVFERTEEGLNITVNDNNSHIFISGDGVSNFEFADGTVISDIKNYLTSDVTSSDYTMGTKLKVLNITGDDDVSVIGNDNNNSIISNGGNNTFEGKGGDDYFESLAGGNDTYVFNLGDGCDYIKDLGGNDVIKFGEGINANNIRFVKNLTNNDLEIYFDIENCGDGLTVENFFGSDDNKIEKIIFADGTEITDIASFVSIIASEGDITLSETTKEAQLRGENNSSANGNALDNNFVGNIGDNTFNGGAGDDSFFDEGGSDRFIYNLGDGQDYITNIGGMDAIIFGNGITKENIIFTRDENNLVISFVDNDLDSICIDGYFASDDNKIELFKFANGDVLSDISAYLETESGEVPQIVSDGSVVLAENEQNATLAGENNSLVLGNNLDNTIVGNSGNNTYYGGAGNDTISDLLGGNDTYIYQYGNGDDVITDLGGVDTIKFEGAISPEDVIFEKDGDNLVISFREKDGSITVNGYFLDDNHKIENITFQDGRILQDVSDILIGISTTQSYTIAEDSTIETVRMYGENNISVTGNSADNRIEGNSGNNTFEGKGGDDTLVDLEGGNDTYIYNLGDGNDTIIDNSGNDKIKFGNGITLENTIFIQNQNNLEIIFDGQEGSILVQDFFANTDNKIENFEFADGTVITDLTSHIKEITSDENITMSSGAANATLTGENNSSVVGNALDNTIVGNSGNNTITGGLGNDYIESTLGGDDTYIYNLGDGYDTINELGGNDKIKFGAGITKDSLVFVRNNSDLLINFKNADGDIVDGNIRIENYFEDNDKKIETLEFADGSTLTDFEKNVNVLAGENDLNNIWNLSEVQLWGDGDYSVIGSYGDETIIGNAGNNTYNPQSGNDTIIDTEGGNDTYIYKHDSNNKFILDIGGNDTVKFGSGIELESTNFVRYGNNLRVYFPDVNNAFIQIEDYFVDDAHKIERFEYADGTVITDLTAHLNGIASDGDITLTGSQNVGYLLGDENISLVGTANDDNAYGNSGNNTYNMGAGDDNITDKLGGDDTYIYNVGDGHDYIIDIGGNDKILFGEGITAANLTFENRNGDLNINVENGDIFGSILVSKYFKNDSRKIETIEFADGTTITDVSSLITGISVDTDYTLTEDTQIRNLYLNGDEDLSVVGNSADNHFEGNAGNGTFEGKGGNDSFYCDKGGNDTYIYNVGDGYDWITDIGGNDTIRFGEGITANNVSFNQTADGHLEINFGEQDGSIVIEDYFNTEVDKQIENFVFSDGTTLTDISSLIVPYSESEDGEIDENTVNSLIQEMNSYAPEGEMANGDYNQNNDELLQLVAC